MRYLQALSTSDHSTVKAIPVAERGSARALSGNSLETLAKECAIQHTQKITFLPSRSTNLDGHLVRLRKNKPDVFKQVVKGELSMIEARKAAARHRGVLRGAPLVSVRHLRRRSISFRRLAISQFDEIDAVSLPADVLCNACFASI